MTAKRWFAATALVVATSSVEVQAQVRSEVWQLVTFRFQPGKSAEGTRLFREDLRPIYQATASLAWFRGFQEVESPEPLDLVAVSGYAGMGAMDRANEELKLAGQGGKSVRALYGALSDLSEGHHDQFVEIDESLGDAGPPPPGLVAYEYIRLVPGGSQAFERLIRQELRPWERTRWPGRWIATGRMLVSDGWTHLRVHQLTSLADWQQAQAAFRPSAVGGRFDRLVAARKVILLRAAPEMAAK